MLKWTRDDALPKMTSSDARILAGAHKELDTLVAKGAKLLAKVPCDDEGKLREKMRREGNAIAATQGQISQVLARIKSSDPRIGEGIPAGGADVHEGEAKAAVADAHEGEGTAKESFRQSFAAGQRMDDSCYYHTCLYVALTLFNSAGIRHESEGKAEQEKLKDVLETMTKVKGCPSILPDSVREMCSFVNLPCDLPASSSSKGGTASAAETMQPPPAKKRRGGKKASDGATEAAVEQQQKPSKRRRA